MDYLSLLFGLAGLWFGTELTIRGAVTVAARLGVSEFIVGVAILSIGSDLPELAIAIDGAIINLRSGDASDVIVGTATQRVISSPTIERVVPDLPLQVIASRIAPQEITVRAPIEILDIDERVGSCAARGLRPQNLKTDSHTG